MTEHTVMEEFLASSQNLEARKKAVNSLRHLQMDEVTMDAKDNASYLLVYEAVMSDISSRYPSLSQEVQRQVAKKKRWQERRSLEEHKNSLHI